MNNGGGSRYLCSPVNPDPTSDLVMDANPNPKSCSPTFIQFRFRKSNPTLRKFKVHRTIQPSEMMLTIGLSAMRRPARRCSMPSGVSAMAVVFDAEVSSRAELILAPRRKWTQPPRDPVGAPATPTSRAASSEPRPLRPATAAGRIGLVSRTEREKETLVWEKR